MPEEKIYNVRFPDESSPRGVPESGLASAMAMGGKIEDASSQLDREARAARAEAAGVTGPMGAIKAAVQGALHGATFGGTTIAQSVLGGPDSAEYLNTLQSEWPTTTAGSRLAGAIVPSIASGGPGVAGAISRATPAGALSRVSESIIAKGAGGGLLRAGAYGAAGGSVEGLAESAGDYLAQVSLGNKKLAADAFTASVLGGGVLGGGVGGLVGMGAKALANAKKLFPKGEITKEAADLAESKFVEEIKSAISDDSLQTVAEAKLREGRHAAVMADPEAAKLAEAVRASKIAEAQSRAEIAAAKADSARSLAQKRAFGAKEAEARAEIARLKADKAAGRTAQGAESAVPAGSAADTGQLPEASDLESLLAESTRRLQGGETMADLAARKSIPAADDIADIERSVDHAVADLDPSSKRIKDSVTEYKQAKSDVKKWISDIRLAADKKADEAIAAGKLSRSKDVITDVAGSAGLAPGQSFESYLVQRGRQRTSRLRNEYTVDELAQRAQSNPTFLDFSEATGSGVNAFPKGTKASDDLIDRILSGVTDIKRLDVELTDVADGKLIRKQVPATAEDVISAVRNVQPDVDDLVIRALRGRMGAPELDIPEAISKLSRLERAEADLVDAVGPQHAPAASSRRAEEYRAAQSAVDSASLLGSVQRSDMISDAASSPVSGALANPSDVVLPSINPTPTPTPASTGGFVSRMQDVASALEMLSELNIPGMPSAKSIPVIGPVLSYYLKARAMTGSVRRAMGKLGISAESIVAGNGNQVRERMHRAASAWLDGASTVTRKSIPTLALASSVLARPIWSDVDEGKRRKKTDDASTMWADRADELERAKTPGAIEAAIRARVGVSDPELFQNLVESSRRKIEYLDKSMPKPPPQTSINRSKFPWSPPESEAREFSLIKAALDDPAATLEQAAQGTASVSQMHAIRDVMPHLWADVQSVLVSEMIGRDDIPYDRRIYIGLMFGIPLDHSSDPEFASALSAGDPQSTQEQGQSAPRPPTPGMTASLTKSINQMTLQEDR